MSSRLLFRSSRGGFTLVELLVVIVIIGVLAALTIASAGSVQQRGQAVKCLASLRQVGAAVRAYVNDREGFLPDTSHSKAEDGTSLSWIHTLGPYLGSDFIGRCPSNRAAKATVTYGWNDNLVESGKGIPALRCETPGTTMIVGESADSYISEHFHFASARSRITYNQFKSSVGVERHGQGANYLFVDGHVETLTPTEVKKRLDVTDSKFLKP